MTKKMKNAEQAALARQELEQAEAARKEATKLLLTGLSERAASGPFYLTKTESQTVYDTLSVDSLSVETELADVYDIAINRVSDARNPDAWAGLIVVALRRTAYAYLAANNPQELVDNAEALRLA